MKKFNFRQIVIALVIIAGIIGVVLIINLETKRSRSTNIVQNPENEVNLNIPKLDSPNIQSSYPEITSKYQIAANLPNNLNLPQTLPIYRVENPLFQEKDITQLAKNLGFSIKPTKSTNYQGETVYSYYEGYKTLEILLNQKNITFNTGVFIKDPITTIPNNKDIEKNVVEYLKKNHLINPDENIELTNTERLQEGESYGNKNSQPYVGLTATFTKKLETFPLLGSGFQSGNIQVTLNSELEIMSVQMTAVPQITKLDLYPLKSKEDIVNSLQDAILSDLDITNPGELYSKTVKLITIRNIEVVYLEVKQKDQASLEPFFLLKGTAGYSDGTSSAATLQLPAISSDYIK